MTGVINPHDRFFKETFGHPQVAADFLRSYLPQQVTAVLDLDTLELEKETFIDQELRQHSSDLICRAKTVDGMPVYAYLIFEHKSYPDPLALFQLLRYLVRKLERLIARGEGIRPVICVLLYHGEEGWRWGDRLSGLYVGPDELRPFWPELQVQVFDFSAYSETEIRGALLLRATLLLMQSVFRPDLLERLPAILELIRELTEEHKTLEYVEIAVRYLFATSNRVTPAVVKDLVEQVFEERGGEVVTTVAEQLIQQGIEQGMERGIERGIERGMERGMERGRVLAMQQTVNDLLFYRFGAPPFALRERLTRLNESQLREMSLAILDAKTLDDVRRRLDDIE